jgi:hypothetical protein
MVKIISLYKPQLKLRRLTLLLHCSEFPPKALCNVLARFLGPAHGGIHVYQYTPITLISAYQIIATHTHTNLQDPESSHPQVTINTHLQEIRPVVLDSCLVAVNQNTRTRVSILGIW